MKVIKFAILLALLLTGVTCSHSGLLWAQTSETGALTVTVKDPSGSVIPGATVTVNNGSGLTRAEKTDANGSYTFTLLPPGTYGVAISAPGFKVANVSAIAVDVSETHVVNQSLEVGTQAQSVTVNATTETVQTESSALGGVVDSHALTELPMPTRNYTSLLGESAGVVVSVTNASAFGRGDQFIFANGEDDSSNTYLIDGTQASSYASGTTGDYLGFYGSIAIPSPDSLQEFKVQTSNYDAGFGRTTGASVNIVTKSGSNDFHGTLFEFVRNNDFNANTFLNVETGTPRGELKQNQFGGTVGGPIIKDKLFFFFSYQGTRQINGVAYQGSSAIDLPAQLTDNRTAATLGAEFCPANNPVINTQTFTLTGAPNPPSDQVACDGSNINPVALALLNYKLPNGTFVIPSPQKILNAGLPTETGFSTFSDPATFNENQEMFNVDYVITPKQSLSLKYFYAISPAVASFFGSGLTAQSAEPPGGGNIASSGAQNFGAKLTSILSDTLVNEVHYSDSYIRAGLTPLWPVTGAAIGMTPAASFDPLTPDIELAAQGMTFGGILVDGNKSPATTYEWQDQLSWSHGRHSLRFGYDGDHVNWYICSCGKTRGQIEFQTFSDFLLGMNAAQNGTAATGLPLSNVFGSLAFEQQFSQPNLVRQNSDALFVQDDFKVNRRLTLNMGLRWEYAGWAYDDNPLGGTDADWNILQTVPIPPASGTYVGLTLASGYKGPLVPGLVRRQVNMLTNGHAPFDDFAPRFGFAWQPFSSSGRFVVRGGYGWFYQLVHGQQFLDSLDGEPPLAAPLVTFVTANQFASEATPFNPPVFPGSFTPFLRTPTSSISLTAINPNIVTPLSSSWSFNIQYAIKPSWQLEVGYVGSRSIHIFAGQDYDVPQLATATDPLNCGAPFGCVTTNTAGNAAERMPVLGFSPGGLSYGGNWGDSGYNSLQVTLRKSFSHGLQFQAAYTWDKCLSNLEGATFAGAGQGGDVNYDIGLQNLEAGKGECGFDRPQRLVVSYLYNIPNYHGAQGVAGKVLSGWGLSGLTTIQAGLPMAFTDARGGAVYGSVGNSGAQLCAGETVGDIMTHGSVESRLNDYFNASAFCVPPIVGAIGGVGGSTGYGNLRQNILLGPGQFNWDIGVVKNTVVGGIHENATLEFRAEFFNAFNHAQFSNPNTVVSSVSTFGVISSESVGPRIVQLALKYIF
jgi:hypothetical protein